MITIKYQSCSNSVNIWCFVVYLALCCRTRGWVQSAGGTQMSLKGYRNSARNASGTQCGLRLEDLANISSLLDIIW